MKHKAKQRHFMSSKDLYFLPNITSIKQAHTKKKKQLASHSSVQRIKSIQQIMLNKSIVDFRSHNDILQIERSKKSNISNLYDKYDFFPKIFALKNQRKNDKDKSKTKQPHEQLQQKKQTNKYQHSKQQNKQLKDKENNFNFQSFYYLQNFNRKIEQEIGKIQFNIKYSFSHNNMIIAEDTVNDQQNLKERQPIRKKYTKIQMCQKQEPKDTTKLEKVPTFLLRLIQTKRQ